VTGSLPRRSDGAQGRQGAPGTQVACQRPRACGGWFRADACL